MSPPPVWGEMAKWVGELGIVARGWQVHQWKSRGQDGSAGDVHPISLENTVLPENKQFNQPQHKTCERRKTKKSGAGFQKQKKTKQTNNCFLQYFFFYSCFFFLLLLFFKTLKLESSVAPHTASFFRLAELYTLWSPAWMIQKKNYNNSNNENLLYAGGNFTLSFLLWSLGFLSFLSTNGFLFLFLSLLCMTFLSLYLHLH